MIVYNSFLTVADTTLKSSESHHPHNIVDIIVPCLKDNHKYVSQHSSHE